MDSLGKWVAGGLFIGGICAGIIASAAVAVASGLVTVQKGSVKQQVTEKPAA